MNGLQNIIAKIEEESGRECEAILAAAKDEADRVRAEYDALTAEAVAEIDASLEKEAEAIITRARSASAMTRRNVVSGARSKNVDAAYKNALDFIYSLPREKYAELVISFAIGAIKNHISAAESKETMYGESVDSSRFELVFNEKDRADIGEYCVFSIKNNRKKDLGADVLRRVVLADDSANIDGGVIVRCGQIEENCSFSLLVGDLREKLDPVVYKTLYPEV